MQLCFLRPFAIFRFAAVTCLCSFGLLRPVARAADGDTTIHQDHNHHRLLDLLSQAAIVSGEAVREDQYEPDFVQLDRDIIGRAEEDVMRLANNAPRSVNISQGNLHIWTFPMDILEGPPGQARPRFPLDPTAANISRLEQDLIQLATQSSHAGNMRNVFLTISTCDQPSKSVDRTAAPPQLEVYVSRSPANRRPDVGSNDRVIPVQGGYGNITLRDVMGDIWVGVRAPESDDFTGEYNYELAASIDAPYATHFEIGNSPWDTRIASWDTDSYSAILATGDITNSVSNSPEFGAWLAMTPPPFTIYVNRQRDPWRDGLRRSVCGLKNHAQVKNNSSDNNMVEIGGQPKQLFYVEGLDRSSSYDAFMALDKGPIDSTIGGGGAVWSATTFTTKSDNNCKIIHSLPFCTDVAYAVPSNPNMNMTALVQAYDTYANDAYQNFSKSLQQIPCNTTASAQYSLARNCQDCDNAYKTWLCAVTIPRCADFSSPATHTHLMPRSISQNFINGTAPREGPKGSLFSKENITSKHYGSSRNPMIDDHIKPGPYKEMLPCKDLCYHLMQNCPAALQFACPAEGRGLNYSYGHHSNKGEEWMCNWPGGRLVSSAGRTRFGSRTVGLVLAAALYVL
ncbi:MAG: hypothetical protein Q9208_002061 [Pyrenodesmia sp. 3 TL-2023]